MAPAAVPGLAPEQLVAAAVRAPSVHNTQPWRFVVGTGVIEVHADATRVLHVIDPSMRELTVSCGAAIFNLQVAAAQAGRASRVRPLPGVGDATRLATVELVGPRVRTGVEARLYGALWRRRTSRRPFLARAVPGSYRAALIEAARAEGARLWFPEPEARADLLTVTREADRRQQAEVAYRMELNAWTTEDPERADGVHTCAFGPRSVSGSLPARDFGLIKSPATRIPEFFESDPTIAVLTTEADTRADWLRAGRALQRVLLMATVQGLSTSFLSQALECVELRSAVRHLCAAGMPQVILRIGYGRPAPLSRRRLVRDVMRARKPTVTAPPS